ncbi:MAG: nuclear transport factor 2 family protein [Pseudomonadales bacterium]
MSDRVSEFVSREEIRDLSRRYMRGLDRLDMRLLGSVFAEDATVDYGFFQGSARDFVDFAHGALKDHHANHHLIGQMLVEVDGDTAVGEIYFQAYHRLTADGEEQELFIAGRYVDRYVRRDGTWKILFRSEVSDWTRTVPVSDPFFQTNKAALRGARAPEDYSAPFFPHLLER